MSGDSNLASRRSTLDGWLLGERVCDDEPAAQLVVKVSGGGDADAVSE
jgi:hypothetical protein